MDRPLRISTATNRKATFWTMPEITWTGFVGKLREPERTAETFADYLAMPKSQQDEIKDVGGFVGGSLKDGRRKAGHVLGRDLITLDLDAMAAGDDDLVLERLDALGCEYAVYSTRKHQKAKPRLRVIIPTDRTMTADEYGAISRQVAQMLGMQFMDRTTFEPERLMYWPSCSKDSDYTFRHKTADFLGVEDMLGLFENWRDVTSWPVVPGQAAEDHRAKASKQQDPLAKEGLIGAFCRAYSIEEAIAKFIPDRYEPTAQPDRLTYVGGSTTGGAIVYDGKYLYSHHSTDPTSGQLVNAFDLVRLHLYAGDDADAKPGTPTAKLPSYQAMQRLIKADEPVMITLGKERIEQARNDFAIPLGDAPDPEPSPTWMLGLETDANARPVSTISNVVLILHNDPLLRCRLGLDVFANRGTVDGPMPWDPTPGRRAWGDVDDAGLRHYLEATYHISGRDRIFDALALVAYQRRYDDVADYLNGLTWDGIARLDTIFADYLGAEDTIYTRAVARKSLTAAVARVMAPGTKYDYMPILTGPQGIGKSTLLRLLGRQWYSDSLTSFEGKEAAEMIQGTWINELGELTGLNKSETNSVKQFLSKIEDLYRVPYGRRTEIFKRRCIFFGTSNDHEYLRDTTGNRRFWPVDVGIAPARACIFDDLPAQVDQIWAEAVMRYREGELLYLTGEAEEIAKEQQQLHQETSSKEGLVGEYLAKLIPTTWNELTIDARRLYYQGVMDTTGIVLVERETVCAIEVWAECFGNDPGRIRRADSVELNGIISTFKNWQRAPAPKRVGPYGSQRYFTRKR